MSGGALLRFDDVACVRGGRLLFEGVALSLSAGEAALVTGPNGAGKSSLLRLAAGLLRASAGQVIRTGAVALADDGLALDDKISLSRALAFWTQLDGRSAEAGLEAFGLHHLGGMPVRMLSTGQRKRATLARVAASGAPIWLLDEPANGLDAEGQERLAASIDAHRSAGGVVLAASHQPLGLAGAATVTLG